MKSVVIALMVALFASSSAIAQRLNYTGSSTIGKFISASKPIYGKLLFNISTISESEGGERCILKQRCDLGGVAREVDARILAQGVSKTLIGSDTVAVIVNSANPVDSLTREQVKGLFTGKIVNWSEVGGDDRPVKAFVVRDNSATYGVFREIILGESEYRGTTMLKFDAKMIPQVVNEAGAIGQITSAFLLEIPRVKAVAVDGIYPDDKSGAYPITRPLYLLTSGKPEGEVKAYLDWVVSEPGQAVVRQFFGGIQ